MKYIDSVDKRVLDYFNVLEPNFPEWLNDYIETKELLKQRYISMTCGTIYSDLFESEFFFSSLDHSVAVALIVWHFTHDKKQTLSGLFHDIATPVFKHCVDFEFLLFNSLDKLQTKPLPPIRHICDFSRGVLNVRSTRSHPTLAPRPQICLIGGNGFCAVAGEDELNRGRGFGDRS